jgi:predicted esterase
MNKKKFFLFFIGFSVFLSFADNADKIFPSLAPSSKSYALYVEPFDWGAVSTKVVVNAGKTISAEAISAEDFIAGVYLASSENSSRTYGPCQSEKIIRDAFLCSENGEKISGKGKFFALEFAFSPDDSFSSPFVFYTKPNAASDVFGMKITNEKLGISISRRSGIVCPALEKFSSGESTFTDSDGNDVTMTCSYFIPQKKSAEKIPLIIFLHGSGEGGKEFYNPILKTPAAKLAGEKIQSHFDSGAAVLVPVCPVNWLVSDTKDILGNRIWVPVDVMGAIKRKVSPIKKALEKISSVQINDESVSSAKISYYTEPLKKLIDEFIGSHGEIDADRIYIGGASAGGYMTLNMVLQYPDFFAASFPVCEAFPDGKISDDDIEILSEKKIWFTVSKNDETLRPENYTLKTYARLENSGAENAVLCTYEKITDMNGYRDEDGNDYEYEGHYAWVYVLNDFCFSDDDESLNLFDWLGSWRN